MSMLTTNCSPKLVDNPGAMRVTKLSALHTIVFHHLVNRGFLTADPLIGISVVLRRVFKAIEKQAFLRVIALSRVDLDRERILVAPRLYALPPLVVSTTVFYLNLRETYNSSELKCFLLIMCIDDDESTTNSRSSGLFEVPVLPCFNRSTKRSFVRIHDIVNIFAKSHAALRAHLSWCKVSSCDLLPILSWCHVPFKNFDGVF